VGVHGRLDASASIMAAHNDVFYLKIHHSILQYAEEVKVGMHDHIRNISVHKEFSRYRASDLVCGYPAVAATNPKKLGSLDLGKVFEKIGIILNGFLSPGFIL
jgi:hypothetical protein